MSYLLSYHFQPFLFVGPWFVSEREIIMHYNSVRKCLSVGGWGSCRLLPLGFPAPTSESAVNRKIVTNDHLTQGGVVSKGDHLGILIFTGVLMVLVRGNH